MNLYAMHDNRDGLFAHPEDVFHLAVWARDSDDALGVFCRYTRNARYTFEDVEWRLCVPPGSPGKTWPHVERRPWFLRLLSWSREGERSCDTCGLYPMGLEEFSVCHECYQCRECGCDCEEK